MKSDDFLAWLSAISGMSAGRRTEALAALEKAGGDAARESPCRRGVSGERMRWGRPVLSGSSVRGARIARVAKSSAGVARMGFCGFAARVAGARSTR